ncbi:MAG: hypothetical protein GXY54_02145 [Deltaproteobacteria bacterium]|nr:hypothetical protein [Deltaproteobacteria bacterium]
MSVVTRIGLALAAVGVLVACSMPMMEKGNQLEVSVREYLQRLRWKDYYGAAAFMKEEHREDFLKRIKAVDGLNLVNVTLVHMERGANQEEFQTVVVIEYYILPSLALKEKELRQKWVIVRPESWGSMAAWMIDSPFPGFP